LQPVNCFSHILAGIPSAIRLYLANVLDADPLKALGGYGDLASSLKQRDFV
jgi:hypothetical protein